MSAAVALEATVRQFVDSLLLSRTRHVLCLSIADPSIDTEKIAADHLRAKSASGLAEHREPAAAVFAEQLAMIAGRHLVVSFADLDRHPKCVELLAEHVRAGDPGGKLVVVSRHWSADRGDVGREIRKRCLFYQQSPAPPSKGR